MTYQKKLKDPRWQRRRLVFLDLKNWRCEDCGRSDKELQVHHYHYHKGLEPWEYKDHQMRCCCADCHIERQGIEDSIKSALAVIFQRVNVKQLPKFSQWVFTEAMKDVDL